MKLVHALTSLACLLIVCSSAFGGIRPSFHLQTSSWRATDIVVVTEEKQIDGVVKVLETWKGDLKPGHVITLSELAEFNAKNSRMVRVWAQDESSEYISGTTMVLFLRDATKIPDEPDDEVPRVTDSKGSTTERWKAANSAGDEIKYSTVWIDKGKTYCFVQVINPGPSVLVNCGREAELKPEVSRVIGIQNGLQAALAIVDPATRAQSLEPFAQEELFHARKRAMKGLIDCGEAALPVLGRMLNNESLAKFHDEVIEAFAKAGRRSAGPELTAWLKRELAFWKQTAPSLQVGWWNGAGFEGLEEVEPLRNRWMALYKAVYALGAIRYVEATPILIELSEFWRTLPQMGQDQINTACDRVLRQFQANTKGVKRPAPPKYEFVFTGNKIFSSSVLTAKIGEYVSAYYEEEDDHEQPFNEDVLEYALRRLEAFIFSQGHLEARFESARYQTANGDRISVEITEGRQYRLGKITIQGAKLFSPERLRGMLALQEGEIANGEAITKWLYDEVEKAYADLAHFGYSADRDKEYRVGLKDHGEAFVDYVIKIEEGPQFKIASIKFDGTASLKKEQLTKAMSLREGEVFSRKQLDDSIEELKKLGLDLSTEDIGVFQSDDNDTVDIVIVVSKDRFPQESFDRFAAKRNWYRSLQH
jgi:surface antigen-like variable number repeat protein/PBS lyase HEAT-like repeat-containing protein